MSGGIPSAVLRSVPVLHTPGQDRTVRRWKVLGDVVGPAAAVEGGIARGRLDARLYLDRGALRALLAMAEASPTGRVVVHGVEFDVEEREAGGPGGHRYMVIAFEGAPGPEPHPLGGLVRP